LKVCRPCVFKFIDDGGTASLIAEHFEEWLKWNQMNGDGNYFESLGLETYLDSDDEDGDFWNEESE
jgi:hypothetical protein